MVAVLAVTITAAATEGAPATARLAGWLASWAASRRYAGDPDRAARRAAEWRALACRRPGRRVLGLLTAAGFALAAVRARIAARRETGAPVVPSAGTGGEGTVTLSGVPAWLATRPTVTTDTLLARGWREWVPAEWDAASAVGAIYAAHYPSLGRLAVLLVGDVATAEEVVQYSFRATYGAWHQLRDTEKALSYLHQSMVNRSRSVGRHRAEMDKDAAKPAGAGQGATTSPLERSALIAALWTLLPQQREALVLKTHADLSEAQIATAMGIRRDEVKNHTDRGLAALRGALGVGGGDS
jgi:RNA polymerase sigma factor (sigma-70 family)